jgi:hypothetical protein
MFSGKLAAAGIVAMLVAGGASAQVETDIKNGDSLVAAMIMGEGEHMGQAGMIDGFSSAAMAGRWARSWPRQDSVSLHRHGRVRQVAVSMR